MRGFATFLAALAVIGLGYWAYHQTLMTQAAIREVETLQRAIGTHHERLSVLRAEWAYLNRPDRLRELANFNFERLGLMPLAPDQFGFVADIPMHADVTPPEAAQESTTETLSANASTSTAEGE